MSSVSRFIKQLEKFPESGTVKNPYTDPVLSDNLRIYFEEMLQTSGKRVLLVGEAPGYKGCKLTGIPFSSGTVFERFEHPLLKKIRPALTIKQVDSENTATIVWEYLTTRSATPLFWNSFPFHPHPEGAELKNRAPTAAEMKVGLDFLAQLGKLFKPEVIGGIGRKGALAAERAFPEFTIASIRHPSHGGKRDFIAGMDIILS